VASHSRSAHFQNSALREIILEHAFVGDLLRHFWRLEIFDVEILRSEFDAGGHDLVVSRGDVTRHVQLKAKRLLGRTREFTISERLVAREAGCVLVFVVADDLAIDHYRWFGAGPKEPLPIDRAYKLARHTKGDASGAKSERQQHFRLPLLEFTTLASIGEVAEALVGTAHSE